MRKLSLVVFIALAFTFTVQAQTGAPETKSPKIKSDIRWTTYALRGPVKSVRAESATYVFKNGQWVEGPRQLEMTVAFAEDGNRTEVAFYREGVLGRRIEDKYDQDGRQIEFLNYDGAGNMWLRGTFAYDDDGKVKEEVTYNGDGSVRSKRTIKRTREGQILETVETNPSGIVMEKLTNTFVDGALDTTFRSLHYADGKVARTEFYEIPKKRVETIMYKPDGSIDSKTIRVDREISEYAKDGTLRKTTTISTQGRLLDEVMVGTGGSPTKREAQLPDQLDSHENWIVQTKWQADANGSRPLKTTYRTITYYQNFIF